VFRKFIVLSLLFFSGAFLLYSYKTDNSVSRLAPDISPNKEYQKKDEKILKWIDKLEEYECRNCPAGFGKVDRNGLFSYSCLQFQKETFMRYLKKFYPETYQDLEGDEWQNLIYDCDFQKELAYQIIENNPDAVWHWKTSIKRGLGLP